LCIQGNIKETMNNSFEDYVTRCGELGYVWPDRTSLTILFGAELPYRTEWNALLKRVYGSRVLELGYRLCGRSLPLALLPAIAQQEEALTARLTESPGLAPLLVRFLQLEVPVPRDYAVVRVPAIEKGLTPAGWRWLTRQRADVVRKLLSFGWTDEAIGWMNILAKANPHAAFSARWFEAGRPYGTQGFMQQMAAWSPGARKEGLAVLERYFRLLPADATGPRLVEHELILAELFRKLVGQEFTLIKPQQSWAGLLRKVRDQQAARLELARERAAARATRSLSWSPKLGPRTVCGISVTELCNEAELLAEGITMSHCVGDGGYTDACADGKNVIFSLAHASTGSRATLQLVRSRHKAWTIGQLAGPANGTVPAVFWNCAKAVCDLMSTT
jgi:hypothetical protein